MLARHESDCPLCPEAILIGDRIEESSDIDGWSHFECAKQQDARAVRALTCTDCFIIQPCECDS